MRHQRNDAPNKDAPLTKTERFTGGDTFSIVDNCFNKNNALQKNCASKTTEAAAALTTIRDSGVRLQR